MALILRKHGTETANYFNEKVWGRVAGLAAREIVKKFDIREKGLEGFVKALKYFPWTMIVGYHIEQTPREVIVSVPGMPDPDGTFEPRTARVRLQRDAPWRIHKLRPCDRPSPSG